MYAFAGAGEKEEAGGRGGVTEGRREREGTLLHP
jgi:hypothetical protein